MGAVIIISNSTKNLHSVFRKPVGVYPTKTANVLLTVFNHVQSEENLTDSYALYRIDVNAVDYMSTTGRSLPDSCALLPRCERCRLHVDHRAFTARPDTYYAPNDASLSGALPHQSPHCATTQVWVSVFECGKPVHYQNVSETSPCSSLATTAIKM